MSDNHGDRPDENTSASTPENPVPDTSAPASGVRPDAPAPADATPPVAPATPPAVPGPVPLPSAGTPAAGGQPIAPAGQTPPAWQQAPGPRAPWNGAPQHPGYPAPPAAGPSRTAPLPGHPGLQGQAFGVSADQPTLVLPDSAETRKKSGAGKVVALVVAAALVGGAAGLGGAYAGISLWGGGGTVSNETSPQTVTVNSPDDVNATTAIAAKVVPSVVTISASSANGGGTGSGVILTADGYVVTNTHVVTLDGQTGDAKITATTSDGRVWQAEVVGTDPIYDLAVIKLVDASGLTPMEVANSDDLNVGDATVAVGAPLGLSNTVTTGIVSALNRSIAVASSAAPEGGESGQGGGQGQEGPFFFDFGQGQQSTQANGSINISVIQTDAAINPGNSGGALVDDEGKLIGINVAIASAGSSSGGQAGSIGVGFAIPSDIAQRVADEIIKDGAATHGLLGASLQKGVSSSAAITGAQIAEVTSGGAADRAGVRAGDIVTAFAGKPVTNSVDLTAQVRALPAGAETTLTYVRDGEARTVDVTLGTLSS